MEAYFASEPFLIAFTNGDRKAFDQFFHAHWEEAYAFAYTLILDPAESKDIASNAFIYLHNSRKTITTPSQLRGRLFLSIRNRCLDYKRKIKTEDLEKLEKIYSGELDATFNEIETTMVARRNDHIINLLTQAIDKLPTECGNVVRLIYLERKKYQDVADELQISINTVKSHRTLGIQKLKDLLPSHELAFCLLVLFYLNFSNL